MIRIEDLEKIISIVESHEISHFEFEQDSSRVVIEKSKGNISGSNFKGCIKESEESKIDDKNNNSEEKCADKNDCYIKSSLAGTFYLKKDEASEPFVKIGDNVKEDTIVGLVEVMKLFNEIEAEKAGYISKILIRNGEFVEFGQPLFELS
ncbi:MAG: acetyl-CoA carboxylase biotin carboxyl carrier protein subunit [Clostridium sp.]|nr:acetyl-CoA carboxylase biotin carboxyl carrier protein subunit [Clostridium sp.]